MPPADHQEDSWSSILIGLVTVIVVALGVGYLSFFVIRKIVLRRRLARAQSMDDDPIGMS